MTEYVRLAVTIDHHHSEYAALVMRKRCLVRRRRIERKLRKCQMKNLR